VGGEGHDGDVVLRAVRLGARRHALERSQVAVPPVGVGAGHPAKAALERRAGRVERGGARVGEAEREPQVPVAAAVERRLRRLHDVAIRRGAVLPVHAVVVAQVDPAVAGVEVAGRGATERGLGDERAAGLGVLGEQRAVGGGPVVVVAVVAERRVDVRVYLVRTAGERLEAHVDEQRVARGVGDVGLDDPVAPGLRRVDLAVGEAALVDELDALGGGVGLAVGERPAVGDDELQVAQGGRAEVRVVDLGQLAALQRVPELALRGRRRAEALLVGRRPERLGARGTGCRGAGRCTRGGGHEDGDGQGDERRGQAAAAARRGAHGPFPPDFGDAPSLPAFARGEPRRRGGAERLAQVRG
jgi:hypothetical protein